MRLLNYPTLTLVGFVSVACTPATDGEAQSSVYASLSSQRVDAKSIMVEVTMTNASEHPICIWPERGFFEIFMTLESGKPYAGLTSNEHYPYYGAELTRSAYWPEGWTFRRIEARSTYTYTHSERFSDYSENLGAWARNRNVGSDANSGKEDDIRYVARTRFEVYDCDAIPASLELAARELDAFNAPYVDIYTDYTESFAIP